MRKSSLNPIFKRLLGTPKAQLSVRASTPRFAQHTGNFCAPIQNVRPSVQMKRQFHATAHQRKEIHFMLADIGEGITQVEVKEWFVKAGDVIKQFEKVAQVESDKASVEITSRYDGKITKLHYAVGDVARVGAPLLDIDMESPPATAHAPQKALAPPTASQTLAAPASATEAVERSIEKVLTTPAVRRIAREHKIDLLKVNPTGPKGRLLKEDLLNYLKAGPTAAPTPQATIPPKAVVVAAAEDRVEPVKGFAKVMIKTMTAALSVPHLGFCDEYNMDKLIEMRIAVKRVADEKKVKLTFMPFFIKAISTALKDYPILNAQLSADETQIIYKSAHNIGIAMDTPLGLVVPNIKNVENKSILEIAAELNRLMDLGAQGKLQPNDLKGGTFSISNVGAIGGTYASPIIVPPEVCIGAIGKMQKIPRFDKDNNVIATNIIFMSWSADHRIVEGAVVARFSKQVKQLLEEPVAMFAYLK